MQKEQAEWQTAQMFRVVVSMHQPVRVWVKVQLESLPQLEQGLVMEEGQMLRRVRLCL